VQPQGQPFKQHLGGTASMAGAIDHQDSFAVLACGLANLARPRLIRDRLLMKESGQSHRIILAAANRPHRENDEQ
jgi:hypothetical protein